MAAVSVALVGASSLLPGCGALDAPGGAWGGEAGAPEVPGSGGRGVPEPPTTGGDFGTGGTPYVEPECPEEPAPPPELECDPEAPFVGCESGYACYPFLDYPYGTGCDYATSGARCLPAGSAVQGEECGTGVLCAPGYLCVVGTGSGARCAQLCSPVGEDGCPAGLLCAETDVQGYGVCS